MLPVIHTTIDLPVLERELTAVRKELAVTGLYDKKMRNVDVFLVPFNNGAGYRCWGGDGSIAIPEVAMNTLRELFDSDILTLRDVLRHAFGHAFAETHPAAISSDAFTETFHDVYSSGVSWIYDPEFHVSEYAAGGPAEDFAEVFAEFVARKGKRPRQYSSEPIRMKWDFLASLTI